jgi:hypothetical protein
VAFLFLNESKVVLYFHISLLSPFSCFCFSFLPGWFASGSVKIFAIMFGLREPVFIGKTPSIKILKKMFTVDSIMKSAMKPSGFRIKLYIVNGSLN